MTWFLRSLSLARCPGIGTKINISSRPFAGVNQTRSSRNLHKHSLIRKSEPLRILFCGSDAFSCEGLRAVKALSHENACDGGNVVESIDVVVRPGKPTGRGLKTISHVPLKELAENLRLPIHELDTFTGWKLPSHINLIIAMSFGLFVPPRVLKSAKYGGLNVHPSFLPDLRGPAPLHHMLLKGYSHLGVTLQTLDENKFDHGKILAQTPRPGIPIPNDCRLEDLFHAATEEGVDMLRDGLLRGLYIPPLVDVGRKLTDDEIRELRHAPKLAKADMEMNWAHWSWEDASRRLRVFGPGRLWCRVGNHEDRVILEAEAKSTPTPLDGAEMKHIECASSTTGRKTRVSYTEDGDGGVLVPLEKGGSLFIRRVKVAGEPWKPAIDALRPFAERSHRKE